MRREIQRLTPFAFQSDFSAPEASPKAVGDIILTADELSALLADTRQSTADLVRDDTLKTHAETMRKQTSELKSALSLVADLAQHLQAASLDEHDRKAAIEKVRRLASTLLEGQADLFRTP